MENRNKYITIAIILLALIIGFSALYFSGFLTRKAPATPTSNLTEQEKLDILSQISTTSLGDNIPNVEKQKIINTVETQLPPTSAPTLTDEERLRILNQAQ